LFDDSGRVVVHDSQGLRVYSSGSLPGESQPPIRVPAPPIQGFGFATAKTSDGTLIVLARSANLFLWRAQSPDRLIPIELPRRPVGGAPRIFHSIQMAPDGRRFYAIEQSAILPGAAREERTSVLRVWQLELSADGDTARARDLEAYSLPDGVNLVLGHNGKLLAFADRTGQVTVLDASKFVVLSRRIKPPGNEPETSWPPALAFSPDDIELAVGSDRGAVSLWSLAKPARPQLRLQLPGHRSRINCLAYEPNGRRLASATFDAMVEVWDLDIIDRELSRLKLTD
jgi:WD40 repeat protein